MPIAANGNVFFKTELEIQGGPLISEISIFDYDLIEGEIYYRVFFKRGFEADLLIGHFREDISTGTAVFRPLDGEDILVYDISLEEGDQLVLPARWCDGIAHDTARVLSVTQEEGRRLLTFDRLVGGGEICEALTFREEIGPNASVIFPYFRGRSYQEGFALRLCHVARGGVIFYPAGATVDFCGVPTSTGERLPAPRVQIFPTVFRDQLTLKGVEPDDEVLLLDLQGRPHFRWRGASVPPGLGQLPSWAYYLRIGRDGQPLLTEKLIKL
jgi:hypothetical protein